MPGFTYTGGSNPGYPKNYIAFGGADRRSWCDYWEIPAGTGLKSFTGIGFQPECVIFFASELRFSDTSPAERGRLILGVATATDEQWCMEISMADNTSNALRVGSFSTDACLKRYSTVGVLDWHMVLDSFDANGFTIDVIDEGGLTPVCFLALRGGGLYKCGVDTVPAGGGAQSITVGFAADVMFLASTRKLVDGWTVNESFSMGACDRDGRQFANWMGGNHDIGVDQDNTATRSQPGTALLIGEVDVGVASTKAEAVCTGFTATDVDLDWIEADDEYLFGWLACQEAATDRFITNPTAWPPGAFVETPVEPVGLFGYCTHMLEADENTWNSGAGIGISAADDRAPQFSNTGTSELCVGSEDCNENQFGFQQSGSDIERGVFGSHTHRSGCIGAESLNGLCDIRELGDFIPQIYRRVIQH